MCETAMPWKATPTKSIAVSRPGTPVASHASPAITIMWSAGVGFSAFGCTGSSRAQETISPVLTSRAAAARFAGVIRFSAPAWSSAPQRPQFFVFSKISSMRSGVTSMVPPVPAGPGCGMMARLRTAASEASGGGLGLRVDLPLHGERDELRALARVLPGARLPAAARQPRPGLAGLRGRELRPREGAGPRRSPRARARAAPHAPGPDRVARARLRARVAAPPLRARAAHRRAPHAEREGGLPGPPRARHRIPDGAAEHGSEERHRGRGVLPRP